jgi:hypothetical protein
LGAASGGARAGNAILETTPPLARFGSGRDPRSDGGGTEHSHQRVVADEGIVVKGDPLPLEPPQDAPSRSGENPGDVLGLGRRERREGTGVRGRSRVDAVEHERVEVGREVQRRPEALDERDGTALTAMNSELIASATALVGEHRAQEGLQDFTGEPRVSRTAIPVRIGEGEDPLPDGHLGQHVVDEMGGGVRHAPAAT